eukprot:scaffold224914_cov27-Tisochrysis_lutea.AAC.4
MEGAQGDNVIPYVAEGVLILPVHSLLVQRRFLQVFRVPLEILYLGGHGGRRKNGALLLMLMLPSNFGRVDGLPGIHHFAHDAGKKE